MVAVCPLPVSGAVPGVGADELPCVFFRLACHGVDGRDRHNIGIAARSKRLAVRSGDRCAAEIAVGIGYRDSGHGERKGTDSWIGDNRHCLADVDSCKGIGEGRVEDVANFGCAKEVWKRLGERNVVNGTDTLERKCGKLRGRGDEAREVRNSASRHGRTVNVHVELLIAVVHERLDRQTIPGFRIVGCRSGVVVRREHTLNCLAGRDDQV